METTTIPTQQELAHALGVDPALVTRYKARGMPVDSIAAAAAWRQANVRVRANTRRVATTTAAGANDGTADGQNGAGGATSGETSYADHRARRERAEADMAELEARRRAGQLIDRAAGERAVFDAFRELRDATGNALRDAADRLVGLTDVREIEHRLLDAQRAAFEAFEARMQRRLQEAAES